mmetsp:Transcript_28362/g.90412  ORF Transcript_28362/g.90412 Transcript_28362/m.90412 type:complete len:290 (+) Transcript_28362:125-994(+)
MQLTAKRTERTAQIRTQPRSTCHMPQQHRALHHKHSCSCREHPAADMCCLEPCLNAARPSLALDGSPRPMLVRCSDPRTSSERLRGRQLRLSRRVDVPPLASQHVDLDLERLYLPRLHLDQRDEPLPLAPLAGRVGRRRGLPVVQVGLELLLPLKQSSHRVELGRRMLGGLLELHLGRGERLAHDPQLVGLLGLDGQDPPTDLLGGPVHADRVERRDVHHLTKLEHLHVPQPRGVLFGPGLARGLVPQHGGVLNPQRLLPPAKLALLVGDLARPRLQRPQRIGREDEQR